MVMTAVFRVDSSIDIGTGHVMRCLAFADELKTKSINAYFICRDLPGSIHKTIRSRGYHVVLLPLQLPYKDIQYSDDYAGWLQVSQAQDSHEFINCLHNLNISSNVIIIVDHYALDDVWENETKKECNSQIIAIDDLVRPHIADIIIDQTLGRLESEYKTLCSGGKILTGSDYALIRSSFYEKREFSFDLAMNRNMNIFITLGGFDKRNILSKIICSLQRNPLPWAEKITVILNSISSNFEFIAEKIKHGSAQIELVSFVNDMPSFMLNYSIAIGAPGTTTWERAALGIPAILIPIAENQKDVAKGYAEKNAGIIIYPEYINDHLVTAMNDLKEDYIQKRDINYLISDGLGLRRIIQSIWPHKAKDGLDISLKKATKSDIAIVYTWQCQPTTRRYARNPAIPSLREHVDWMEAKLTDPTCYFYMIYHGASSVGVIRLDRLGSFCYEVSVFIDEQKQRINIAKQALKMVAELHAEIDIVATVLEENIASQSLFHSLNYRKIGDTTFKLEKRTHG